MAVSELIAQFERATQEFGRRVAAVGPGRWHDPTPCSEWDVRMLVNHVAVEQLWVPPLVEGRTVADVGQRLDGDQLGDDPPSAWDAAVSGARAAFGGGGALERTVSLSYGERPAGEYCWEVTVDTLIHTWDLARGSGGDERLDPELVELAYERTLPFAEHLHESGMYAEAVPVAADDPVQTRLLALFGRRD
jgi:uncharacterized protein (TIGR03086 family)